MSKLLTVLINKLNSVKESSKDITLDFSKGKESVYEDLLIPLMNLTESEDLTQLHDNLNILINESESKSEDFKKITDALIQYIMEDTDNEDGADLYDEFENIMLNCVAMFNSLKSSIENKSIDEMNEELVKYINSKIDSKFKVNHEADSEVEDEDDDDDVVNKKEKEESSENETKKYIEIVSAKDEVDDGV